MVTAQVPARVGWWKFDDSADLLKATIGTALTLEGTQESVAGPVTGNGATQIGTGSYLIMEHGLDTLVNEYTLQIDFSVPEIGVWNALYQTATDNSEDAESFINTDNFVGAWRFGYSTIPVEQDTWYRMIVSVKNGEFYKIYMNGELWVDGAGQDVDSRDALKDKLLVFADNDAEDATINCSGLGIWDVALTADQVTELGDATTDPVGIKQNSATAALLGQNYPNPFNGTTTFAYQVNKMSDVSFSIVDFAGREIKQMNEGQKLPGSYTMELSAENLNNGVYFIRMTSTEGISTKKFVVNR